MNDLELAPLSQKFVKAFFSEVEGESGEKFKVNPVVSEVAGVYEKIRSAMEYQEEEVVFRSAIERILRRRLLFESKGETLAWHLVRELAWAKYFPDNTVSESKVEKIARKIDLYLDLYKEIRQKSRVGREKLSQWLLQILSSDIAFTINPNKDIEIISNYMFHILEKKIKIVDDDDQETKNALIFISIKRALAHEDKAFLRYQLFVQYFGGLSEDNLPEIINNFSEGFKKIESVFKHPLNDRIYSYVKKQSVPFLILRDVLGKHKDDIEKFLEDKDKLTTSITAVCNEHYKEIGKRVQRAITRSVIFLAVTKVVFALLVEGSFEKYFYGGIQWWSLAVNTTMPPIILLLVMLFIQTPSKENTTRIIQRIKSILFDEEVGEIELKTYSLYYKRSNTLYAIFSILWLGVLSAGIWGITLALSLIKSNPFSQAVFVFFLVIVSFLAFRINQSAKSYNVSEDKDNFGSILFNFLFMPFVQLGRRLTLTFSKVNIFLILFDFVIETPFKTVFAFMEQWFSFLRSERERLD